MSTASIYDAFAVKLEQLATEFSPRLPVAYPGINFESPSAGPWLELSWYPNETQNYGLANSGPSLLQGFGQVSVCYRPGGGIMAGSVLADLVADHFGKGTILSGTVRVDRKPWTASIIEDASRVAHPVTVPWRGFDA